MRFFRNKILTIIAGVMTLVMLQGCHTSKKESRGDGKPGVETVKVKPGKDKGPKGIAKNIVAEALTWQGTPYKYAGTAKKKGTDCSGMVWTIFQDVANVQLPRNSLKQAEYCTRISDKSVKAGDLVFFATGKDPKRISHVGIMIDGNKFVHASTKKGVIISDMTTPYYKRTFIMYGRALK